MFSNISCNCCSLTLTIFNMEKKIKDEGDTSASNFLAHNCCPLTQAGSITITSVVCSICDDNCRYCQEQFQLLFLLQEHKNQHASKYKM